jgi:hypothetical protein
VRIDGAVDKFIVGCMDRSLGGTICRAKRMVSQPSRSNDQDMTPCRAFSRSSLLNELAAAAAAAAAGDDLIWSANYFIDL